MRPNYKTFSLLTLLAVQAICRDARAGLISTNENIFSLEISSAFLIVPQFSSESTPRTELMVRVTDRWAVSVLFARIENPYNDEQKRRDSAGARIFWFLNDSTFETGPALDLLYQHDNAELSLLESQTSDLHSLYIFTRNFNFTASASGGLGCTRNTNCPQDPFCGIHGSEGPSIDWNGSGVFPDFQVRVGVSF